MNEKYGVIQNRLNAIESLQSSSTRSIKTADQPIYFNYFGATNSLKSRAEPQKQENILYSFNGDSSEEVSYFKENGTFVTKQGFKRHSNLKHYIY